MIINYSNLIRSLFAEKERPDKEFSVTCFLLLLKEISDQKNIFLTPHLFFKRDGVRDELNSSVSPHCREHNFAHDFFFTGFRFVKLHSL